MTKKKWQGIFKWVNIGQDGKYWPIRTSGNHLNFRCKFLNLTQLQESFRSLPMTIELLSNKLICIGVRFHTYGINLGSITCT